MKDHTKGLLMTTLGILIVSPDSLLIRLAAMDTWTLSFYRGLFMAIALFVVLLLIYRGRLLVSLMAIGWTGVAITGIFALNSVTFIAAVQLTSVANALVLLATAPFFAALLTLFVLKERVPLHTWVAIVAALLGVCLIVGGSWASGGLLGDILALVTAASFGLKITLFRMKKNIDMIPAMALAGLLLMVLMWPFAEPSGVSMVQVGWVAVMGLLVIGPGVALLTYGPRFIPPPEASLIIILETVVGPIWVWLALGETPTRLAFWGGAVVVSTLVAHALVDYRRRAATI